MKPKRLPIQRLPRKIRGATHSPHDRLHHSPAGVADRRRSLR